MFTVALSPGLGLTREADFDALFRAHERAVLRTAYRVLGNWADAEDVAQEAFVRLHRQARHLEGPAVAAWLYRVTVNLCLDRVRSPWRPAELVETPSGEPGAEAESIRLDQQRRLMGALGKLAPRERAAIVLREIEGLTTAEVAAALGSSESTVRSQISKAMDKLAAILKGRV
ncbi:MAG: RNA polymerase sigma factor [Acidobacteria bacterium]|nr:RNA polymerase sigma factor [Acidobacteriota bacterium]